MGTSQSKQRKNRKNRQLQRKQEEFSYRLQKLTEQLQVKGQTVEGLRTSAEDVTSRISQPDRELVEDHLSTVEKKLSVSQDKAKKQLQSYETLIQNYDTTLSDVESYVTWLRNTQELVARQPVIGFNVTQAQDALQQHNEILHDVETRQTTLDAIQHQANTSLQALGTQEREQIDKRLLDLQEQHRLLQHSVVERRKQLQKEVVSRKAVQGDLDKVTDWLSGKEAIIEAGIKVPLHPKEVARELESKKSLLSEVKHFGTTVERFLTEGTRLMEQSENGDRQTMCEKLEDVRARYGSLKQFVNESVEKTQEAHTSHRQLENDMVKVELWLKEADNVLGKPIQLDSPTEMLREQVKRYQNLANSSRMQESIIGDLGDAADGILPLLRDSDQATLKDRLHTVRENMDRVQSEMSERVKLLDAALSHKTRFEEEVLELTRELCVAQEELKQASRGVGPLLDDAKLLQQTVQKQQAACVEHKPRLAKLQQTVDQLRSLGHLSAADEMTHLTRMHSEIEDQAALQREKLGQAVTLREQYHAQRGDVENVLKLCQEQIDAVEVLGVAVHTKLDRYKNVLETVQAKEAEITLLSDRAQQIGIEGTSTDVDTLQNQIKQIMSKAASLKKDAARKSERLQHVIAERHGFEDDLAKTVTFLQQKDAQLRPHNQLGVDVDGIEAELRKLRDIKEEVLGQLQATQEQVDEQKARYDDLDEVLPLEIQDKIDEMNELKEKIQKKIQDEEEKLVQAKDARIQFRTRWQEVTDWLKKVDDSVKADDDGANFEMAESQLQQHKTMYATEEEIHKKMDELLDLSEQLAPSLDLNDKATLKESINNMNRKVSDTSAAAEKREKQLEETVSAWKHYQEQHAAVESILLKAETQWQTTPEMPLVSLDQAAKQLETAQDYLSGLAAQKEVITQLRALTEQMDRRGSTTSQVMVDGMLAQAIDKYNTLKAKAEERQTDMQETVDNWEMYQEKADALKSLLQSAESQMVPEELERATSAELQQQLLDSKGLVTTVDQSHSDLAALQRSAQIVLAQLPTSEAKMSLQRDLLNLQDQYEQLQWKAKEQQRSLETEVVDREKFAVEVLDSSEWLTDVNVQLQHPESIGLKVEDVEDRVNQHEILKQDIGMKIAQIQHEIENQIDKYGDSTADLPQEIQEQVEALEDIQRKVTDDLENKDRALQQAKVARKDYHTNLGVIKPWLDDAEARVKEPIRDPEQGKESLQALINEMALFKPKLDAVEARARDVFATAPDHDQELLSSTVSELKERWSKLASAVEAKSTEYNTAADLWKKFNETEEFLSRWTTHAETMAQSDPVWRSMQQANDQIEEQRAIVQEGTVLEPRFERLEDLARQLAPYGSEQEVARRIELLREAYVRAQSDSSKQLDQMEETVEEWRECHDGLDTLKDLIHEAKQTLDVADTSVSLQERLVNQERILKEIEKQESKMSRLLTKHETLRSIVGLKVPTQDLEISAEIAALKAEAQDDRDQLQTLVDEQIEQEEKVKQMEAEIEAAQLFVEESLDNADSIEALQEKAKEADALEKQQQLEETLQKQESYQLALQDVTARLEQAQQRLTGVDSQNVPSTDINMEIKENQDLSLELQLLEADIRALHDQGEQLAREGHDPEGQQAIQATLNILQDRYDTIKLMAQDKDTELQASVERRQKHEKQRNQFQGKLQDFEDWLTSVKINNAGDPFMGYDVAHLRVQVRDNQNLREELNSHLQQLSDMGVECEQFSEFDSPAQYELMRLQLTRLQDSTNQFQLDTIQKQDRLKEGLKESEKKKKDLEDYKKSVKDIGKWIKDTRNISELTPEVLEVSFSMTQHQKQLQQKLELELAEHQDLIRAVSKEARKVMREPGDGVSIGSDDEDTLTPDTLQAKWKQLSRQLSARKTLLQDTIDHSRPGDFSGLPLMSFRPHHLARSPEHDSVARLNEVRRCLDELNSCWQKLQGQVDDQQARLEHTLHFQHLYQEALLNISAWLDDIEGRLFSARPDMATEEQFKENETLQNELQAVQGELSKMSHASQQLMSDASADSKNVIRQTIADLHERLGTLDCHAKEKQEKLQQKEEQTQKYQTEACDLQHLMMSAQLQYATLMASDMPLDQKLVEQSKLEKLMSGYEDRLVIMQTEGDQLVTEHSGFKLPAEVTALRTQWRDLHQVVTEKRAELEKSSAAQDRYKRLLQEYEEYLETAQNKLRSDTISAPDLSHLQNQLATHKGFFSDLESHRTLLEALAQNLDRPTRQACETTHTRLMNLTHVVQDRAAIYGQKLERLIHDWLGFRDQFEEVEGWFSGDLVKQVPEKMDDDRGGVIGSLEVLRKRIWDYHTVQKALDDEKALMIEVVDRGHQLLQSVSCPALEGELADFAEHWVHVSNETDTELKRLQTMLDQWEKFERDATAFENWLDSAKDQSNRLAILDTVDTQNIVVLRNKMEHFLEFRKDVENQQTLKTKVSMLGQQLQRYRPSDSNLQDRIERMETTWLQLVSEIPNNEEQLHQAQMELLPSRQALNELLMWLETIESTILEDTGKVLLNLVDTQVMLQKYRGLKVDMTNRQLTVDFVNQSSTQASTTELESPRGSSLLNEKTEFDERLGQMNKRYQASSSDILERLKNLEMLEIRWNEFEKNYNNLVNWFTDQQGKLDKYGKLGHEASLQQTIKDCQVLHEDLHGKEKEMKRMKENGLTLVVTRHGQPSPDGILVIQGMIDELTDKLSSLEHQTYQTQSRLEDALRQWSLYNNALQRCNQLLTETEYSFNRFNVASGDIEVFKELIEKIKVLHSELENSQNKLQQLTDTAAQLVKICEPAAGQSVQKTVDDVQNRWQQLNAVLSSRMITFDELYMNWRQYEREFERVHSWIDSHERDVNTLLQHSRDSDNFEQVMEDARTHQHEVDMFRQNMAQLSLLSDRLTHHMDNATIIHITARETALNQRLHAMQHALSRLLRSMQQDFAKKSRFQNTYQTLDSFLASADDVLRDGDPNQSSEEEQIETRIDQLRDLTTQFSHTQTDLDSLNLIGYRMPLSEDDSNRLKTLNQKWYSLSTDTAQRFKTMQGHLLLQQDFSEKCEAWMSFLGQVENSLAVPVSGTYDGLLDQQKAHEVFQNEMYSRQQILHAIIAEGHQMIRNGDVDDRYDFEHKLNMLEHQWQSVIRRSQQRRVIIDNLVRQWRAYRDSLDQLNNRLDMVSESLSSTEIQTAPLQKIRSLYNSIKSSETDVSSVEPLYQKVNDTGRMLMQNTDLDVRHDIETEMKELQDKWRHLIGQLESRRAELEHIIHQWDETEAGMEDMLAWLKDIRKSLMQDLPESYDDLQTELHTCIEYECSFKNCADRKLRLTETQEDLASMISSHDMSILQQRLQLLNKQWQELHHQVELRHERIECRLARWVALNEKYRELMDQMAQMDDKISSGKDYHVEDFLHKLENDYKKEMSGINREREHLVHDGQTLMRASGEIRASDIEYKLSKINDKWSRLQDKALSRQKKLQETLSVVQQLEQNMRLLRQWLAHIEHELGAPIVYVDHDFNEIQDKLQNQQELQRDIHKHSTGVASVVNLCEVLLHDTDACPTAVEQTAIQQAIQSLDRRWKNICNLSGDRRHRIEDTWHMWQKFHNEYQRFSDWLREAERLVENPRTEHASFATFKDELRKFENFQKTLHEKLHSLEDLSKQYRQLAREARTDTNGGLKHQIHDMNKRWDELNKQCQSVLRRLRHMVNVRDDFTATREALLVWLSEVNSRITQMEHFSNSNTTQKLKDLQILHGEIEQNSHRLEYIEKGGEYLLQKCESRDAVGIQKDLDEFRKVVDNVITRLGKCQARLQKASSGELSDDTDDDLEYHELPNIEQIEKLVEDIDDIPIDLSSLSDIDSDFSDFAPALSPPAEGEILTNFRSQRASPADVIVEEQPRGNSPQQVEPLSTLVDWDMDDVDLTECISSPVLDVSPRSHRKPTTRPVAEGGTALRELREKLGGRGERVQRVERYLHEMEELLAGVSDHLRSSELQLRAPTPVGPQANATTAYYSESITSCQDRVEKLSQLEKKLKQETGLPSLYGAERQIKGVVKRWHSLQHAAIEKDHRLESRRRQWKQLQADLQGLLTWLDAADRTQLRQNNPAMDINQLELSVRDHREFLLEVDGHRPLVLSINLLSKEIAARHGGSRDTLQLQQQLGTMNQRWDRVCARAAVWQKELQIALFQGQDFNKTLDDLFQWLRGVEADIRRQEPVDFSSSREQLRSKYSKFREMKYDLEDGQDKVISLHDTTDSLLTKSEDSANAKERLHVVANQLKSLLKICETYMTRIESIVNVDKEFLHSSPYSTLNGAESSRSTFRTISALTPRSPRSYFSRRLVAMAAAGSFSLEPDPELGETIEPLAAAAPLTEQRRSGFLSRVCRMALPIQGLMLLLLGIASLVPMSEDDFSCALANNFRRSLDPMLQYPDGAPPF